MSTSGSALSFPDRGTGVSEAAGASAKTLRSGVCVSLVLRSVRGARLGAGSRASRSQTSAFPRFVHSGCEAGRDSGTRLPGVDTVS